MIRTDKTEQTSSDAQLEQLLEAHRIVLGKTATAASQLAR